MSTTYLLCVSTTTLDKTPNNLIVYIFIGSILLHNSVLPIIAGTIIGLIGVAYVVLEFVPSIEPPQNMRYALPFWHKKLRLIVLHSYREADGGWGAEQV